MTQPKKAKRQHYIPKLLLRHFGNHRGTSKKQSEIWVYLYQKGEILPVQSNIKEAFTKNKMHVIDDDYSLENHFAKMEAGFGRTIEQVLATHTLNEESKASIVQFIANLLFRTLAVRQTLFEGTILHGKAAIIKSLNTSPEELASFAKPLFREEAKEQINQAVAEMKPNANRAERKALERQLKKKLTKKHTDITQQIHFEMRNLLKRIFDHQEGQGTLFQAIKKAHVSALFKISSKGKIEGKFVDLLSSFEWTLLEFDPGRLVLPDTGVIIYSSQSDCWGFSLSFDFDQYDLIYLPISPKLGVIGKREPKITTPSEAELITASVASSWAFFASQNHCELLVGLMPTIGTCRTMIDDFEFDYDEKFTFDDFKR